MDYGRREVIKKIRSDPHLMEEILTRISETQDFETEYLTSPVDGAEARPRGFENLNRFVDVDRARRVAESPPPQPTFEDDFAEAIILRLGRPVLKIRQDSFDTAELGTDVWGERLESHRENLLRAILSVGRIEIENHLNYTWVGTGWVLDADILVTNRHVAQVFAQQDGQRFVFRQSFLGTMSARIDFREEHQGAGPMEIPVLEVLHIEPEPGPDLAFLRVAWEAGPANLHKPLPLSPVLHPDHFLATIGYPAKDTRTNISAEMDALFGNVYDVKRLAPGQVMHVAADGRTFLHDCTTLGGNSGSAVVDMESGQVMGLHFAGREEVANFAVPAPLVRQCFEDWTRKFTVAVGQPPPQPVEVEEELAPTVESLGDREGYQADFLGVEVGLPALVPELETLVAPVEGRDDGLLNYTHYSLKIHLERGFAIYTACNIDGLQWRRIPRGTDKWFLDPRLAVEHQVDNSLYKSNKLDRGHLVRRIDPTWGDSYEVAKQAEEDTFFYTNCAPQHKSLNRDLWLGLEDYILENADVHDLKVTVFGGPVFRPSDRPYRGRQIPEDFWKVVAMLRADTQQLSATAYMLTQVDFLDDLEFTFGAYQTYQVPVAHIENLTGLDFGALKDHDPLAAIEAARPFLVLDRLERITF